MYIYKCFRIILHLTITHIKDCLIIAQLLLFKMFPLLIVTSHHLLPPQY